jgi:hypothetical protein
MVTMKRRKRVISILVACGFLLAANVVLSRWLRPLQPQICRLPDGSTMTLLGTTYGRHHRWTSLVGGQGLWAVLHSLLRPGSQVSQLETPTDAFVFWIKVDRAKGIPFFIDPGSRIEVSDSHGNRQVIQREDYPFARILLWGDVTPLVISSFPRRDNDLTVRFYRLHATYTHPDAVFHVSNPVPRSYPRWTPEPIPATRTSGDLQVTLTDVSVSDQALQGQVLPNAASYLLGPKTQPLGLMVYGEDRRVTAHFRMQGSDRAQWGVSEMWVSDATGNLWSATNQGATGYGIPINTLTYLAPADGETLRYTVECNSGTDAQFPAQALWTLAPINVPGRGQRLSVGGSHSDQDLSLKLLGITGIGRTWAKPPQSGAQPSQDMPTVYLEVTGACCPYLSATDEIGRRIQGGGQNIADRWFQPDTPEFEIVGDNLMEHLAPGPNHGTRILMYRLNVPSGSKHLNLTFAINKTRTFEFTVPADAGLSAHRSN